MAFGDPETGSVFGNSEPVVAAPVVETSFVAPPSNGTSHSINSGDTNTRADSIAESQASDTQLLEMYRVAIVALSKYKGADIPQLLSFDRGDIQAALNTAQANLNAEEGKKIQQEMMGGALALVGVSSVLTAASGGKEGSNSQDTLALSAFEAPQQQFGESILGKCDFSMRSDSPLAALLREENKIVALEGGKHFSDGETGQLSVPAGLPEVAAAKLHPNLDGLGDHTPVKHGAGAYRA